MVAKNGILIVEFALSRARFADTRPEGQRVPDPIQATVAAGIALHDLGGWSASLRTRYFGPRDLIEDGSDESASSLIFNARIGCKLRRPNPPPRPLRRRPHRPFRSEPALASRVSPRRPAFCFRS